MFPPLRQISPLLAARSRAALNFLTARGGPLACALFLLAGLVLAGDYGISSDQDIQREIAIANLNYILGQGEGIPVAADRDEMAFSDRLYGVAFELPLLLAERALGLEDYYYIHRLRLTLTHLFFIVGGFFCYRLACHLFNNRLLALVALLIFLLHPRLYAHSYLNSKDLPFLSMFIIALYLLERAFRRDTIGAFILLGIGVGLLTNLRIMGIMLFAAPLGMRGLDWFYAGSATERKHILGTAGLFLLAAGLTWYAVSPYAWANPVDYLTVGLESTIDRPGAPWHLFQGAPAFPSELPPQYNAVWFSITTPPLVLLLGVMGMAAVLAQGLRRPGAVFRNTRLRFAGLLLAAFLLPPLAALLGSNQYDNWRHFYFIYAPFCLLAVGGLGGLARRFFLWRPGRAGVYGLAGLGLGLVLFQMMQLHPWQHDYFNFLVDRTTPERLRTEYQMNYWRLAYRKGLEYLLARHPGETLVVLVDKNNELRWQQQRQILPPAARQRLPARGRRADYELLEPAAHQPAADYNLALGLQIYNNTLIALRPLHAARMPPEVVAAYRELYRQAVAGEPIIRADYDVYREGQRLTFVRENCSPEEPDAWFGVLIFSRSPETLPSPLRRGFAYTPLRTHGVRVGRLCLAVLPLPDYASGDLILRRGHWGQGGPAGLPVWEELYSQSRRGLREVIADYRRKQPPPDRPAAFEVFLDQDAGRNRLLYAKKNCATAEYATRVTLHIYPANLADLPAELRGGGFDNRDFHLTGHGGRPGGECLAVYPLPDYPIAAIRTGQAGVWETNLYPPADPEPLRAAYAALAARQPALRDFFALYIQDKQLTYLRESCAAADTAAKVRLHIIPKDPADLPAEQQAAGYANRDFDFGRWGGHFDGKCLATVPLPDYPIAALRTGQAGRWAVNWYPPVDPESLRATSAALAAEQPAARDYFDLYIQDNQLIYWRETCAAGDTAAAFFLHIIPEDRADLPPERRAAGFAHQDFDFARWGGPFDGQCLAAVPLPDYPIAAIRTGQAERWAVDFYRPVAPDTLRAAYAAVDAGQPVARSAFDLYIQNNRLIYLRESCAAADTAAGFFLHIVPEDVADLPAERHSAGFAHRDFDFARWGGSFDGKCLAAVPLPDYPIAAIRTGQEDVWAVAWHPPADPALRRADYAALAQEQPVLRNAFDLYLQDNRLLYLRETCATADTAAGFFLHIIPADVADLPAEQQAAGFANRDFAFAQRGAHFDGKCLAAVSLPDYPIREIRTGQYVPGQGEAWSAGLVAAP